MEKEELITKVNDELGSTQLTISERTFNEEIEDVLEDFGDDEAANGKIIERLVKRLKRIDGNLHADVGAESRRYREKFEKDWKEKHPEGNEKPANNPDDEPAYFKAYREKMEAKFETLENERKQEKAKVQKETVLKQVKDGLKDLFAKADIEPNSYIMKQTMRDIDIPEEGADVDKLVKQMEKAYYKNLKEAGLANGEKPRRGGGAGDKSIATALWNKKKAREGFGK